MGAHYPGIPTGVYREVYTLVYASWYTLVGVHPGVYASRYTWCTLPGTLACYTESTLLTPELKERGLGRQKETISPSE